MDILASLWNYIQHLDTPTPYTPYIVQPPIERTIVRLADSISDREYEWVQERDYLTKHSLVDWLDHSNMEDFNAQTFLDNSTIHIGLAFSGGGYRAMLVGAGEMSALDDRQLDHSRKGSMSGLLQASTYVSGLSGGSWLLASMMANNWSTVQTLAHRSDLWNFETPLAPSGDSIHDTLTWYLSILDDFMAKYAAGFNPTLTDVYGRMLAAQLLGGEDHGRGLTLSQVRDLPCFSNYQMPFPLIVAVHLNSATDTPQLSDAVIEFSPYEIGSWDTALNAFSDILWTGSTVNCGILQRSIQGFDNLALVYGTSSNVFNGEYLEEVAPKVPILSDIWKAVDHIGFDVGSWSPNPFFNWPDGLEGVTREKLFLVDGSEGGENIPFQPLIQPARKIDVIFAFDNGADTPDNWPDGSSLYNTYQRQFSCQNSNFYPSFPYVPEVETFLRSGLNKRPCFFGIDLKNSSYSLGKANKNIAETYPPVIIYIPNADYSYATNQTMLNFTKEARDKTILNGYDIMTQKNGTIDAMWRTCVGCAIVLREQQRRGQMPTKQCRQCFKIYSWESLIVDNSD